MKKYRFLWIASMNDGQRDHRVIVDECEDGIEILKDWIWADLCATVLEMKDTRKGGGLVMEWTRDRAKGMLKLLDDPFDYDGQSWSGLWCSVTETHYLGSAVI